MLTKEECICALRTMQYHMVRDPKLNNVIYENNEPKHFLKPRFQRKVNILEQLINEHFELVKENERLKTQLVECERTCKERLEIIVELASSLESR